MVECECCGMRWVFIYGLVLFVWVYIYKWRERDLQQKDSTYNDVLGRYRS